MQNSKLQELADKLYQEGLSKGREQADALVSQAKEEAARIVESARKEASDLLAEANLAAAEAKKNADTEIKMAFRQLESEVKLRIAGLIVSKALSEPVAKSMQDVAFVQSLIAEAVSGFNPRGEEPVTLSVLLPAEKQADFKAFAEAQTAKSLKGGFEITFDKRIHAGFKVGLKDEQYYISFTDKDFENLFAAYLRPHLKQLLFGGE
ncbi:MAG: hypothetical protein AB7C90_01045 [Bacteroidales bacterium]